MKRLLQVGLFVGLMTSSMFVNANEGFGFHRLTLMGGLGGCESSNNIHACESGITNQIALELEWYRRGNFSIYSDRRHTSRLEKEDFDSNTKGPSGSIDTWCYICAAYDFF